MPDASDGDRRVDEGGLSILEATGMFDTMRFLRSVSECRKTDLYAGIGRRMGMIQKLDRLEDAGLIVQRRYTRATVLSLTEKGRQVADLMESIRQTIEGDTRISQGRSRRPRSRCPSNIGLTGVYPGCRVGYQQFPKSVDYRVRHFPMPEGILAPGHRSRPCFPSISAWIWRISSLFAALSEVPRTRFLLVLGLILNL